MLLGWMVYNDGWEIVIKIRLNIVSVSYEVFWI